PEKAVIGATVLDLDLASPPSPETVASIDRLLERYGVLIFPDQSITPRQQV
ncbi:MAG: TauD/TfdA family dioxygenase, partial [Pseudomonas stutzeri]|nr:TauD/TfdA family dioxygenase [Stutzerimonas stutzeri]NIN82600.1 TauD/TfdA family dioxygenase [Stutzerimonas stutzeri]NIP02737.1 TauD/TfdA family dioxygenase [Stutzerimonas stutzeri]NIQ24454.1 TauD/TfdA family dioxygenase [Stutzerimonas stutzeri]